MQTAALDTVEVDGMTLAYRELGAGPPVLLLHGWPTSSYLWRDVMPPIARSNRVLALDLPGYGGSSKPLDAGYGFGFYDEVLDGFLAALGIDEVALAVHDVGGPIGVHWALDRPERVTRLALLNTLLYPELSEMVLELLRVLSTPGERETLTNPQGLEAVMRLGLAEGSALGEDVIAAIAAPFDTDAARRALALACIGLELPGFADIGERLSSLTMPVRIVYGEQDRVLPDVAETMVRVKRDLPHAVITALPECGHFLQEEEPERIGELLAEFFAYPPSTSSASASTPLSRS